MATIVALTVGAGKGSQRRIGTSAEATYPTGTPAIAGDRLDRVVVHPETAA